jgi:hypothetical protein
VGRAAGDAPIRVVFGASQLASVKPSGDRDAVEAEQPRAARHPASADAYRRGVSSFAD